MRRIVRGMIASLAAIGVAAAAGLNLSGSLASAAQPKAETTAQFLSRANGICKIATRDIKNATKQNPHGNSGLLAAELRGTGRAFTWESRAFKRLRAPAWANQAGYYIISPLYNDAGGELGYTASELLLGYSGQAQRDLNNARRDWNEADAHAVRLGITACRNE